MLDTLLSLAGNPLDSTSAGAAIVRLLAAALFGAVIGIERELHASAAGLRTHMMIAMAACLFALIGAEIAVPPADPATGVPSGGGGSDPLRLIEAVTAGVAFLAAGSIITARGHVTGLTTGAGMWMAGAIGLASGSGLLSLALIATVLAVIVLWLLRRLSRRLARAEAAKADGADGPETRADKAET